MKEYNNSENKFFKNNILENHYIENNNLKNGTFKNSNKKNNHANKLKKPDWLKIKALNNENINHIKTLLRNNNLHTVCEEAACPNLHECFAKKTATFMIMGDLCTRNCAFCNVSHGKPKPLDQNEPKNIAKAVASLNLKYVVLTSVTRDDLDDGGAKHFANCIKEIKNLSKNTNIEILVPDFKTKLKVALESFKDNLPNVFNHNLETIPRLYNQIRKGANYQWSLNLIKEFKKKYKNVITKSGLMLGLGETIDEIKEVIYDLHIHNCEMLTLGQYLQPSKNHAPVINFITPKQFKDLEIFAKKIGFKSVASGPFVRSSYKADFYSENFT